MSHFAMQDENFLISRLLSYKMGQHSHNFVGVNFYTALYDTDRIKLYLFQSPYTDGNWLRYRRDDCVSPRHKFAMANWTFNRSALFNTYL